MIPLTLPITNNSTNYRIKWIACFFLLIAFLLYVGVLFNYKREDQYSNKENILENSTSLLKKHLFSIKKNDVFYSKISFDENYIGKWMRQENSTSSTSHSISGNAKIIFNLELTSDKQYDFNAKFIIYENSKAFINTFLFSKHQHNNTKVPFLVSSVNQHDNSLEHLFEGDILSLINDKLIFSRGMGNCTGLLNINFNSLNDTIKGNLTTGNCSINLQYEVKIENKTVKDQNISLYTAILSIISVSSIISQLAYAIQIEGNIQRSNSLSLFSVSLNMIWTVYNIYSNFFLLYINIGYFYQFLVPMILFLFHFGCDMKVWILSIETKYNDTRYISLLTFLALTISFSSYFLGLGFYFERNYIILHMILIWWPQIIYNIIYFNNSLFPIFYMIVVTVYRAFIPFYFCTKEINFIDLEIKHTSSIQIYLGIVITSLIVLLSQFVFGSRWFIPIHAYREKSDTLYKKRSEMKKLMQSDNSLQCVICLNELFISQTNILEQDFNYGNEWRKSLNYAKVRSVKDNKPNSLFSFVFRFNTRSHIQKRDYMLTHCNHAFHSGCLELWLEFKKDCPNCRRQIIK